MTEIRINDLSLTDDQKERVLEWFAQRVWQLWQDLGVSDGCCKRYDPLTIQDGVAHSYVFEMEDGGRHHSFRDYNHLEEMMQKELLEVIVEYLGYGPERGDQMTTKQLKKLATELGNVTALECVPEEVEIDGKSIEVILHDNPLVPQLVFEVMAVIAKAHPKDVVMKSMSDACCCAITAQF